MLLHILQDRNDILNKIKTKQQELLELEKERVLFSNNLPHQINKLQLIGRSFYFYDTQTDDNLIIMDKFDKNSFRDENGYFNLDYFDILKGSELQNSYSKNKFVFIKQENFNNNDFTKLSGIKFKPDNTYLVLVKYDLNNEDADSFEKTPLNNRKILNYIMVQVN